MTERKSNGSAPRHQGNPLDGRLERIKLGDVDEGPVKF